MLHLQFPYGKGVMSAALPKQQVKAVLTSELERYRPDCEGEELVRRALENPIGSPPLRELSRGKQRVTIIASDHTRPVPSKLLMPALLQEIRTGHCSLMTKERWQKVELFRKQKKTLDTFLGNGAITRAQHDKSLGDLRDLMVMHGVE